MPNSSFLSGLRFVFDTPPARLTIQQPLLDDGKLSAATVGFVCYHEGLPVNDFRYLPGSATVDLDWSDPWYSRFEHPNLRRQFDAPLSVFLYVEPYEVRQEIVVRPKDLEQWIDLGLEGTNVISIDHQAELKSRVVDYLSTRNPVSIDGEQVGGRLDRIHFIRRTLRSTGVIEPPEELDVTSATLGIIFVYPTEGLPNQVSMRWELFSRQTQSVPAVATDEAGGLPSRITPDDPVLLWKNYLTNPSSTLLTTVPSPPPRSTLAVPIVSMICSLVVIFLTGVLVKQCIDSRRPSRRVLTTAAAVILVGAITWPYFRVSVSSPFDSPRHLSETEASDLLGGLLYNVYRAFDHHGRECRLRSTCSKCCRRLTLGRLPGDTPEHGSSQSGRIANLGEGRECVGIGIGR